MALQRDIVIQGFKQQERERHLRLGAERERERETKGQGLRERDIRVKGIREKERDQVFGAYRDRYLGFIQIDREIYWRLMVQRVRYWGLVLENGGEDFHQNKERLQIGDQREQREGESWMVRGLQRDIYTLEFMVLVSYVLEVIGLVREI